MKRPFAGALLAMTIITGAAAEGACSYTVVGQPNGGSEYRGSVSLVQTGKDTWTVRWVIGSERYEGFAIGDAQILAVTFSGGGQTGTALYVVNDRGGYDGMWAFKGERSVSIERWSPR